MGLHGTQVVVGLLHICGISVVPFPGSPWHPACDRSFAIYLWGFRGTQFVVSPLLYICGGSVVLSLWWVFCFIFAGSPWYPLSGRPFAVYLWGFRGTQL